MMVARRRRLVGMVSLAVLVALLAAPVSLVQAVLIWQIETVDSEDDVGLFTSLALDSAGHPHISYYDQTNRDLKYAYYNGVQWATQTLDSDGDVGLYTSLALDSAGRPHISYWDLTNDDLEYAHFDGTTWQFETVDSAGVVGADPFLVFDSNDLPHIAYYDDSNGNLKYAHYDGATWQFEIIDSAGIVGWEIAMALDSEGNPHVSYYDFSNEDLKYAHNTDSGWVTDTIDGNQGDVGHTTSLALDAQDYPRISYYDLTNRDLKYARFDGSGWVIETVDSAGNVGWMTSLALDSNDQPHISYLDNTNDDLKYAYYDGTTWQIEMVDGADARVGRNTSLVLDSQDQPYISYTDYENDDLKYAHATLNAAPAVDAGGSYSGDEDSPINLNATVNDPESDNLTTAWSYEADSADPGTTCTFGDVGQVDTTFTCDDDGTFTVTLSVDDGLNPVVSGDVTVTVENVAPAITKLTATVSGSQAAVTVEATDPGPNDVLSYAFDCNNDEIYEEGPQLEPSASCRLNPQQEGSFTIGVQVSDGDMGITTGFVAVTVVTELCSNNYTGVLRYSAACAGHETALTLPTDGLLTVCASRYNGLLRAPASGVCAGHENPYVLPDDGPLSVCVRNTTLTMRAVGNLGQCSSHEFGRILAATEVGETGPPRSR